MGEPNLFSWGEFTSASGLRLSMKIEMDALTPRDWDCLAHMVAARIRFSEVEGVPRGGYPFESALWKCRGDTGPLLIVDDVLTTGASMERQRAGRDALGVVVFDRSGGRCPRWVAPIFTLNSGWAE